MITAFEAACGAGEDDFRHFDSSAKSTAFGRLHPARWPMKPRRVKGADQASFGAMRTALGELEAAF
jgi:hypothetical protein